MKKLIFFIALLIALPCYGQNLAWWNSARAGGGVAAAATTAYCTAAATCTATYPGECDVLCEDFEGSAECDADSNPDMDAACRNGWAVVIGTDDAIDFTTAASGSFCTGTTSTNVLGFTIADSSNSASVVGYVKGVPALDDVWVQFYINFTAESLDNTQYITFYTQDGAAGLGQNYVMLRLLDSSGTLNLQARYYNTAAGWTNSTGGTGISTGTWYRIRILTNASGSILQVYLNDTLEFDISDLSTAALVRWIRFGPNSLNSNVANFQIDNISWDDDAGQGACQ